VKKFAQFLFSVAFTHATILAALSIFILSLSFLAWDITPFNDFMESLVTPKHLAMVRTSALVGIPSFIYLYFKGELG